MMNKGLAMILGLVVFGMILLSTLSISFYLGNSKTEVLLIDIAIKVVLSTPFFIKGLFDYVSYLSSQQEVKRHEKDTETKHSTENGFIAFTNIGLFIVMSIPASFFGLFFITDHKKIISFLFFLSTFICSLFIREMSKYEIKDDDDITMLQVSLAILVISIIHYVLTFVIGFILDTPN